mgnify:CR=1 FL=1
MKLVVLESPLAGDFARNIRYARLCALDCIRRGEGVYASHLLMTQFLDDADSEERKAGMEAGFAWAAHGQLVAVYEDLGISNGMKMGMDNAVTRGQPIEIRRLPADLMAKLDVGPASSIEHEGHRSMSESASCNHFRTTLASSVRGEMAGGARMPDSDLWTCNDCDRWVRVTFCIECGREVARVSKASTVIVTVRRCSACVEARP